MSERPISPLRQRMLEDMAVRKFGADTQRNYIRAVKALSEFLGRSPATATAEDLRRFQVHQSEAGAHPVGGDAEGIAAGRQRISDEDWVAMGGELSDEEYNGRFKRYFGIELK